MSNQVEKEKIQKVVSLTPEKIDICKWIIPSVSLDVGASVSFVGTVRQNNKGKRVAYMEYSAKDSMCLSLMKRATDEIIQKYSLLRVICIHRLGKVEIGEASVLVVTESVHREEAYVANRELVEKFKYEFPIWKREVYLDGSKAWL